MTARLLEGIGTSAVDEQHARAEHYKRRSLRLRGLAAKTGIEEIRVDLIVLAVRYERMAAHLERCKMRLVNDSVATAERGDLLLPVA